MPPWRGRACGRAGWQLPGRDLESPPARRRQRRKRSRVVRGLRSDAAGRSAAQSTFPSARSIGLSPGEQHPIALSRHHNGNTADCLAAVRLCPHAPSHSTENPLVAAESRCRNRTQFVHDQEHLPLPSTSPAYVPLCGDERDHAHPDSRATRGGLRRGGTAPGRLRGTPRSRNATTPQWRSRRCCTWALAGSLRIHGPEPPAGHASQLAALRFAKPLLPGHTGSMAMKLMRS